MPLCGLEPEGKLWGKNGAPKRRSCGRLEITNELRSKLKEITILNDWLIKSRKMVENRIYQYNKMYYVVSVGVDENPSFNVPDYVNKELGMGDGFCKKLSVKNIESWSNAIDSILRESSPQSIPILFLECHGDDKGNLVIGGRNSNVKVRMKDFLRQIKALEEKCNQRVLLILAVCNGLNFFKKRGRLRKTIPCSCIVGSYTFQSTFDIEDRLKIFLKKLIGRKGRANKVKSAFNSMNKAYRGNARMQEMHKDKRYVLLTRKKEYFLKKIVVNVQE